MITAGNDGIYIDLHVQPKARKPGVRGVHGDRLKVAVAEPAESGKANEATVAAVASILGVPVGAVSLASGRTSRQKRIHVEGMDPRDARRRIEAALDETS